MKNILKVIKKILCVIGAVFLTLLICAVCTVAGDLWRGDEGADKGEDSYITITGPPPQAETDEEEIPDEKYYPSVEEALEHTETAIEEEDFYRKKMDHVIAVFQNEDYCSVYFQAYKNENEISDVFAMFKIKRIDGKKKYCHLESIPNDFVIDRNAYYFEVDQDEVMRDKLKIIPLVQGMNIEPDSTRFAWGSLQANRFKEGESIEKMRVNGQKPDGIVEYKRFKELWYFWYYNDLKAGEDGSSLKYTFGNGEKDIFGNGEKE